MAQIDSELLNQLIEKFLKGTITNSEKQLLDEWYNEDAEQPMEWLLRDGSQESLQRRLYLQIEKQAGVIKPVFRMTIYQKLSVAALTLAVLSIGLMFYLKKPGTAVIQEYATSQAGKIVKINLPDHSIVWLKGQSHLEYPNQFNGSTRNVSLTGEALFEVSKDAQHPFIIRTGNFTTRVLGTSFNISENAHIHSFKLVVLTGRVLVTPHIKSVNATSAIITPDKIYEVASSQEKVSIHKTDAVQKNMVMKGTEYLMDFEHIAFSDALTRIAKKFNIHVDTGATDYAGCNITADVTDQSLDNTLKILCASVGAKYTINGDQIIITGGGCK